MVSLTESEQKALKVINNEKEVYQKEISDKIGCSDGYASKIANKLLENDLINRIKEENSNAYILQATKKDAEDLDFSLLMAGDMISPFVGENKIDIHSDRFTQWLMNLP